jgi:hypothetical protein
MSPTVMIIGNLRSIVDAAHTIGLERGTYVAVYVRVAHKVLKGYRPQDLHIVYVDGADMVLDQPGIRTYVSMLTALGATEAVMSA